MESRSEPRARPGERYSSQALARAEARQTLAWLLEAAVLDTERTMPEESTTPDPDRAMMVSENLDLVRSILADWERGDFSLGEWAHRDYEFRWADGPEPDAWKRSDEMRDAIRDLLRTWERFHIDVYECRELHDERVLVVWRYSARGRVSGLDAGRLPGPGAYVFHVADAKVRRLAFYVEAKHAFADLGLPPKGD
jgi:ketosteroid isomerase-like protein